MYKLRVNYLIHSLIAKGVPQGSVLGPLLFTIYINCLDYDIQDANFHFYADDSVMYCSASSGKQALYKLQSAFDVIQSWIYNLKLVKEYKYLGIIVDDVDLLALTLLNWRKNGKLNLGFILGTSFVFHSMYERNWLPLLFYPCLTMVM